MNILSVTDQSTFMYFIPSNSMLEVVTWSFQTCHQGEFIKDLRLQVRGIGKPHNGGGSLKIPILVEF